MLEEDSMYTSHWTQKLGLLTAIATLVLAQSAVAATVAYYRFEDSPGFTNDSAGTRHLVNNGAVQTNLPAVGRGSRFPCH